MRDRRIWIVVGTIAALLLAGGLGAALLLFGGDAPPPATLASPSSEGSTVPGSSDASEGSAAAGAWTIDAESGSLAQGTATFAGYRIEEELGNVGTNTAVGRTQQVTGGMSVNGASIDELSVEVDMTTLVSDDDRRDDQLSMRGLETGAFPTATFVLTEPIELGSRPSRGESVAADATGELTVHGVTRAVSVPVEAVWHGDSIEAVASFDVALADFEIEPPTGFMVLSIADNGVVELHLLFRRA